MTVRDGGRTVSVGVFCGSADPPPPVFVDAARQLGEEIGRRGHRLIDGGTPVGLMGVVARAVQDTGGLVVGVVPRGLFDHLLIDQSANELVVADTLGDRTAELVARADAFVVLPGGYGTLQELVEVLMLRQLGLHTRPILLLNIDNFWQPFPPVRTGPAEGRRRPRVRWGAVDPGAHRYHDRAPHRGSAPSGLGVWALLHYRLGWSVQRPIRPGRRTRPGHDRPLGQGRLAADQANAQRRRACLVFFDETALSLTPNVRRTWAPVGQSAVLTHRFNWKKASMAAAFCYGVRGGGAQLAFHVTAGSYEADRLIGVLAELRRFLGGEKATLLWDGLPAHRSRAMRAWLNTQRHWLVVERLPAYAPELNPTEDLWAWLKGTELANLVCPTLS